MQTHQTDFSTGNVYRNIMEVAVPMIIAQILNLLYNIVDRIYIGRIPEIGATALTGVGLCFPIITLITAFTYLFGNGGAPLCSMERGRGNREEAEMLMGNTFVMLLGTGVILTAIGLIFYRPILYAFGASDVTFSYASDYIRIYLLGTLFVMITLGMNPFINSQGFGNTGMLTILIGAVLNILLDPLFIFGFGWGIKGAAWATVIGQVVSGVLVIVYFWKFRNMYLTGAMLKPKMPYLKAIISLGLASCINQIAMAIVQIVLNNILRHYGADSVYGSDIPIACVGVISKVNQMFMAICIGISQGSQPIWGFNYGAKKYDRVRQAYRYSVTACTVIATIFFFCFQIFPHQIVGIFGTGSELYFQFAERYLKIFMFMTFANGIQPVSSGFFTSIGMAKLGIVMSLTRQVIFLLPLIIIFPLFMGIDGVMYAGPIADAAAFALAIVFARRELGKMRSAEIV